MNSVLPFERIRSMEPLIISPYTVVFIARLAVMCLRMHSCWKGVCVYLQKSQVGLLRLIMRNQKLSFLEVLFQACSRPRTSCLVNDCTKVEATFRLTWIDSLSSCAPDTLNVPTRDVRSCPSMEELAAEDLALPPPRHQGKQNTASTTSDAQKQRG